MNDNEKNDLRFRIADEISSIQVGSGYESTTIGISAALEAADALIAAGLVFEEPVDRTFIPSVDAVRDVYVGGLVSDGSATEQEADAEFTRFVNALSAGGAQ